MEKSGSGKNIQDPQHCQQANLSWIYRFKIRIHNTVQISSLGNSARARKQKKIIILKIPRKAIFFRGLVKVKVI
jgi:hypothetical protein